MRFLFALALALTTTAVHADIVVENDLIIPAEIYDFTYSTSSTQWWQSTNHTKYYCVFRNTWTIKNHPYEYPKAARWSNIMVYSSTKEYRPWLKNRATTLGIKTLVEDKFTDKLKAEIVQAGKLVFASAEGQGYYIDQQHWDTNYVYIPPIPVSFDYPFINAIGAMGPSPDWFTGFYLFDAVSEYERTFWQRFTLKTYPWDAGTDAGTSYTAVKVNLDPPHNVERIYATNAPPSGDLLSPDKKSVLPVAEFDCVLHVCPPNQPDCQKPNWPPVNYCDILKYPLCASYCDPKLGSSNASAVCSRCKGNGYEPKSVYLPVADCCEAGHNPWSKTCSAAFSASALMSIALSAAALFFL